MIEEFMLLANCAVARRILDAYPGLALLRRHPTPTPAMLAPLVAAATAAGVAMDISVCVCDSLSAVPGMAGFRALLARVLRGPPRHPPRASPGTCRCACAIFMYYIEIQIFDLECLHHISVCACFDR